MLTTGRWRGNRHSHQAGLVATLTLVNSTGAVPPMPTESPDAYRGKVKGRLGRGEMGVAIP